jgi:WD40 repeat protein
MLTVSSSKEHDLPLTGFDWLKSLGLIVTADRSGSIRIWSDEKKFIREIKFPSTHPIDSVCFINAQGDLIVSHNQRLSYIKFETYWTTTFSHYGITSHDHPCHIKHKRSALHDEDYDDFLVKDDPWAEAVRICEIDRTLHLL